MMYPYLRISAQKGHTASNSLSREKSFKLELLKDMSVDCDGRWARCCHKKVKYWDH